jgi:hypothetical protein
MVRRDVCFAALALSLCWAPAFRGFARQDSAGRPVLVLEKREAPSSGPAALDIPALLQECDRNGAAMHRQLPEYTYLQTRRTREHGSRGKLVESTSTYEAYPVIILGQHRHIITLVSENGVPIPAKELEKERQQTTLEMEAAERENAASAAHATPARERYITAGIGLNDAGEGVWVGVSQFLLNCRFSNPQSERYFDREMITLEFSSCDKTALPAREKYLLKMKGKIWIDASEKVVARLAAWPINSKISSLISSGEEIIVYEQMRLPDGLWVPRRIHLNAIGKAGLFNGTDKDMTFEFAQYQHFITEIKDLQQSTMKPRP